MARRPPRDASACSRGRGRARSRPEDPAHHPRRRRRARDRRAAAVTSIEDGTGTRAAPWWMAFSTSGCKQQGRNPGTRVSQGPRTPASSGARPSAHAECPDTCPRARARGGAGLPAHGPWPASRGAGRQPRDHDVGRLDVLPHQRGDRVERIEQEMRMELHLQRLHLRAGQRRLQMRRLQLALPSTCGSARARR